MVTINIDEYVSAIQQGNTTYLSKAITLAESTIEQDQITAQAIIKKTMPLTGRGKRIAVTGVPGVGKSTFIESFGMLLIEQGLKVAVLAIDPSSSLSGGSILGDKTRMEMLSREKNAFIRPSATSGNLGGVTARTYEAMLLCEAAGFDVVLIETVGVGQSETLVNDITDLFLFLQVPGTGDELQGIKRGIMEMADLIFINKIDDFGKDKSQQLKMELVRSMQFLPKKESGWKRKILVGSGLKGNGLLELWNTVKDYYNQGEENQSIHQKRIFQKEKRLEAYAIEMITKKALEKLKSLPNYKDELKTKSPYELAVEIFK